MIKNTLKNKRRSLKLTTLGFTLIELLAVIVILAIIALIATSVILGIINNVKEEANKRSIENYIDEVEQAIVKRNLSGEFNPSTCIITSEGLDCDGYNEILKIEIDGDRPIGGTIYFEKGTVKEGSYLIKGKEILTLNEDNKIITEAIPEPVSFASDSWKTIAANVSIGNISVYEKNLKENKNNTKEISLTGFTNKEENSNGLYTVRISNTSTPEECNTEGFSQTACGFVIEFEDIITTHDMNPKGEYKGIQYNFGWNVDGYPASSMYTYLQNDIYESLPEDLRNVIINTKAVSSHGNTTVETNFISKDKLYLLSTREVYGKDGTTNIIEWDTATEETRQLDYYKNYKNENDGSIGVTTSNYSGAVKKYNGSEKNWWLRSANCYFPNYFYNVLANGYWARTNPFYTNGVAPAFRIG